MKCVDCKFYVLGRPNAIMHKEGVCHRYPQSLNKMQLDFCGEFTSKVVKNRPKSKKKTTKKKA